jgi:hypothetical protein
LSPKFVDIHGLGLTGQPKALPQVFSAPHLGRSVRLYEFLLPAATAALQRVCDTLFNEPSGGAVRYEPLMPLACLSYLDSVKLNAIDPPQSLTGWFFERDAVFWFPAMTTNTATGATSIAVVPLYAFVDQPQALLTGRELQGWPKELATLTHSLTAEGYFDRLSVTTVGMKQMAPEVQGLPLEVFTVTAVPGSAGVTVPNVVGSFDDVLRLVWDVGGAALNLLRPGVAHDLLAEFRGGAVPLALLKQFRDVNDGSTACYQAIVSVLIRATNVRQGGILPGTYALDLADLASHPIASDLGLDRPALSSLKGFWLDFDFELERGTEVWKA